ncbi:hypothetical protein, partial [Streptosporangium sp. NPDC048865]|uniref:hypothetical protein n=1 Tax=Streptosporangium sp. NPDC048865 TaxID=3155766 RepID=UPI003447E3E4
YWANEKKKLDDFLSGFKTGPEKAKGYWDALWRHISSGTDIGVSGTSARLGAFISVTKGRFSELSADAPPKIQTMWASIQRDLAAGITPSQQKLDAFVQAGGAKFLTLSKNAPESLRQGWSAVQSGIDQFVAVAASKLGTWANSADAKFLSLKTTAPAHVQSMWADIQAKITAGTPVPQKMIDDFVAAGGGKFLGLKRDAPQAMRDMLGNIQRDLSTGLAQATAKLGQFVTDGNGKFLKLRQDAPKHVQSMWTDIQRDIDAGKTPSQTKIAAFVQAGGAKFLDLKKTAPKHAKDAWTAVTSSTSELGKAQGKIGDFNKKAEQAFAGSKNSIGATWSGLPGALATPLRTIIDKLYNGGIVRLWNSVADKVGFGKLPTISLGFAEGGVVPAGAYGMLPGYAPQRDTMLAAVSPGEAWLVPQVARWLGEKTINALNKLGIAGRLPKFAAGGVVGGNPLAAFGLGVTSPDTARQEIEAAIAADQLATRITAAIRDAYSGSGGVLDMLRGLSASSGGGGGDYSDAASDLS